ncbi:hypothetical protein K501DRAFT_250702 [Backusella circina FSU 941]|nr:hypothetical protein K501DRAFT_250702 [Backusella circina FSU 941]
MSSDEEDLDCPLCMEELDIADRNFRPCPCGYQICRFCWHHIKTNLNGRCPACRRLYSDQIVEFVPVSAEEIMRLKKEKKEKERQTREMRDPSRRQLSNIRVVQKNLVYVLNVSSKYASPESDIFKKFGKINKVVISKRTLPLHGAGGGTGSTSAVGIYVTFARKEDAAKAIDELNGMELEGKSIRASYGTTKYCTYYLRHMSCPNPNCMYLHEPGDDVDSYNKDLTSTTASATATAAAAGASGSGSGSSIGKHPNSSTSSSTSVNNGFPNKRPATATKSASATPENKPPPRTWAPIPKVVPITQIAKEEPPVEPTQSAAAASPAAQPATLAPSSPQPPPQQQPPPKQQPPKQPSPSLVASSSKSSSSKKTEKQKKPVIIEEPEKPALPATASWANASPQPVKNVITPSNFGPSLSDALNAPQKPKHAAVGGGGGRKKEKKTKGKMVRLEEFEEAEREAKMGSKPRMADILMKPVPSSSESIRPQLDTRKGSIKPNEEGSTRKVIVINKDTDMEEASPPPNEKAPIPVNEESVMEPAEEIVEDLHVEPVQETSMKDEEESEPVAEQHEQEPAEKKMHPQVSGHQDVTDNVVETDVTEVTLEQQQEVTPSHDDIKQQQEEEAVPQQQPEMVEIKNNGVTLQPNNNTMDESAMIDSDLMDDENKTEEEVENQEEMLAALNNNVIKAFDHNTSVDENRPTIESENPTIHTEQVEQQPLTQQQQLLQNLSSPLVAMDRLSALVQQEIISDEAPGLYSQPPPHPPRFDMGMPMHMNNRRPNMPPPGLGMPPPPPPPEWMGRGGFDPFNGQDPSLVAARRLQHSQRMLEASGLFGGIPPPPGGAPPPPRFPFSPEFNGGPHHFSPHPPPGMFPPPPMMRPHGMPMMPPPPPHMEEMRNEFGGLKINDQSREDLRALLPNVNISFNNLQQRRAEEKEFLQQMSEQQRFMGSPAIVNNDVRTEAQNFFGEFLRKAATEQSPKQEEPSPKPATSLPFQDPAIMSVQQLGGGQQPSPKDARAQNPLLQILGGQQQQQMPFHQNSMEQNPMEQQQPILEQHLDQQKSVEQSPINNRHVDPRQQFHQVDPRQMDLRQMDPRQPRQMEFQQQQQMDPRQLDLMNARPMDPRQLDPRMQMDPRQMRQMEQMQMDPRHLDPRHMDPRQQMQMDPRFMSMEQARMMHNKPFNNNNMFMGPPPPQQNQFPPPFMSGPMMGHMGPPGMMRPPMPGGDMRFRNGPPPPGMFAESRPNDST